jgi:hypothetical protein
MRWIGASGVGDCAVLCVGMGLVEVRGQATGHVLAIAAAAAAAATAAI